MVDRAAVIGTGQPGLFQMQSYALSQRAELVAIWGRNENQLARLRQHYGLALATTDLDAILAHEDIDCVSLCVPNQFHAEWSERALRAGKHVFCEVPMVPQRAEGERMVRAVEETGRILMVGQIDRFEPAFIHIRRMTDSGELGRPFLAESRFLGRGWTRSKPLDWWGRDAANPQIALVSLGCFPISLLRWVMGPIVEVSAYATRQGWPNQAHDDTVTINLRFKSGALGRALVSEAAQHPYALDLAVYGEEGTIINNQLASNRWLDVGRDEFVELPIPLIAWEEYPDPAIQSLFDAEIEAFLESIDAGTPPPVDVHEGTAIAVVLDAVAESVTTGMPVRLANP